MNISNNLTSLTEYPYGLILLNNLAKNDGKINGLEIFAYKTGYIFLSVSKFNI